MTLENFLDKWGVDYDIENTDSSFKLINKNSKKAVIWITNKKHNVGMANLPNIELVADFIELCRVVIQPW